MASEEPRTLHRADSMRNELKPKEVKRITKILSSQLLRPISKRFYDIIWISRHHVSSHQTTWEVVLFAYVRKPSFYGASATKNWVQCLSFPFGPFIILWPDINDVSLLHHFVISAKPFKLSAPFRQDGHFRIVFPSSMKLFSKGCSDETHYLKCIINRTCKYGCQSLDSRCYCWLASSQYPLLALFQFF
jgi:hypothetical protein